MWHSFEFATFRERAKHSTVQFVRGIQSFHYFTAWFRPTNTTDAEEESSSNRNRILPGKTYPGVL